MSIDTYESEISRFKRLSSDTQLPFLEVKLYTKYFIDSPSSSNLEKLTRINNTLEQHRSQTISILSLCHERHKIIDSILDLVEQFHQHSITTLRLQSEVLTLLYQHQQVSLSIIEGVLCWRDLLTRPYPFLFLGTNCLTSILADCRRIDATGIESALPLRLTEYPLCSNIDAIALFSKERAKFSRKDQEKLKLRLITAERILIAEPALQLKVMGGIKEICTSGKFIPILHLPDIIPSCSTGISVSNKLWDAQMRNSIEEAYSVAVSEASLK